MDWLLNIKKLKKEKNLTNEALAEKSGISLGTINKLFSGASADPKFSTLCALSDAFGKPVGIVMRVEDDANAPKSVSAVARDVINQSYDIFGRDKIDIVD